MPSLTATSGGAETARSALPDPPAQARRSSQRTRRLTEYIQAHTGEHIEVVLTAHVQTACVLPADAGSLIDADATKFDQRAARQLVDAVDGDYLVLISTHPANLEHLPLDDQLTADRAQQFGLSLHELGHIRYTNISVVVDHLDGRVDEQYQEFVHGLINYAEDAAIEHQLRAAQSQLAADRLELVNRSITQMASDLPDTATITFTYRDAIQSYLYDHGIYDSGKSDVLLDPGDSRITFESQDDATAFAQTQDALDALLATVLSEPDSVKRGDAVLDCWAQTIKPLLDPMKEDNQQGQESEDADATGGGSPNTPPSPSPSESSTPEESNQGEANEPSTDRDSSEEMPDASPDDSAESGHDESPADGERSESSNEDASSEPTDDFDPENVSLDQTQDDHSGDVLSYPDIGPTEEATELAPDDAQTNDVDGEAGQSDSEATPDSQPEPGPESTTGGTEDSGLADESSTSGGDSEDVDDEPGTEESAGGELTPSAGDAIESDESGESNSDDVVGDTAPSETGGGDQDTGEDADSDARGNGGSDESSSSSNGQAALLDFLGGNSGDSDGGGDESAGGETLSETSDASASPNSSGGETGGTEAPDSRADGVQDGGGGEVEDLPNDADGASTDATADESTDTPTDTSEFPGEATSASDGSLDEPGSDGTRGDDQTDLDAEASDEPTVPPQQSVEPAYDDSLDDRLDALDFDHDAAHAEADRATPDMEQLARDLDETAAALGDLADDTDDEAIADDTTHQRRGGGGASSGSLDSLSILPQVGEQAPPARWQAATAGADAVGGTLRMALRQSRRDQTRSGVTSGCFDRRRAGALARGDVNAFSVRQQGEEKQYDLVLVLDRSSSMSNLIGIAEDAVARFALACEDLGINVAIMDFVHGDARLIKPFSVETEHVQASLMSGKTGGGTPLTDALGLARRLLDQRRDSPLVIIITDGKPGSPDSYQQELQQTFAPVCGLTLALDSPRGQPPERAKDVERFYDRHLFVYDTSDLGSRLDQFAVMFDGL